MNDITTDQPLVSIIMPTYNHAQFIGEAIQSVLNQMYNNFELIIIDNYSDDDTEKIVAACNDDRIRYLKFRNEGVIAASRNFGVENSKGQYVAFLDSDDVWLPEKLGKQIKIFNDSPDVAMTYTRFRLLDGNKSLKTYPLRGKFRSGIVFKYLYLRSFIACSGVMVKRKVIKAAGLFDTNPDLVAFEDTDLWLRIALNHIIKVTDDSPLFLYRIQPQMMSSLSIIKRIKRFSVMTRKYKTKIPRYLFMMSIFLLLAYLFKKEFINTKNYITRKLVWRTPLL